MDQGLGLSNSAAERLQEKLGEELTDNVSSLLGKLTSGELVPKKLSKPAAQPSVKVIHCSCRCYKTLMPTYALNAVIMTIH